MTQVNAAYKTKLKLGRNEGKHDRFVEKKVPENKNVLRIVTENDLKGYPQKTVNRKTYAMPEAIGKGASIAVHNAVTSSSTPSRRGPRRFPQRVRPSWVHDNQNQPTNQFNPDRPSQAIPEDIDPTLANVVHSVISPSTPQEWAGYSPQGMQSPWTYDYNQQVPNPNSIQSAQNFVNPAVSNAAQYPVAASGEQSPWMYCHPNQQYLNCNPSQDIVDPTMINNAMQDAITSSSCQPWTGMYSNGIPPWLDCHPNQQTPYRPPQGLDPAIAAAVQQSIAASMSQPFPPGVQSQFMPTAQTMVPQSTPLPQYMAAQPQPYYGYENYGYNPNFGFKDQYQNPPLSYGGNVVDGSYGYVGGGGPTGFHDSAFKPWQFHPAMYFRKQEPTKVESKHLGHHNYMQQSNKKHQPIASNSGNLHEQTYRSVGNSKPSAFFTKGVTGIVQPSAKWLTPVWPGFALFFEAIIVGSLVCLAWYLWAAMY